MRTDTHRQRHWSGNMEQLEVRQVMSADPLGSLLDGAVQQHSFVDELPPLQHQQVAEQPPALQQHGITDLPPAMEHHRQSQADFWIDSDNLLAIGEELGQIEQALSNAHDQSGLTQVRANYGFDGTGQTVAIIDSGIAYDHFALGGGLGSDYRVVGGWDFTGENDADPYDDGGAGSHGTHVSGIVGASGGTHEGVAPGVDLVGLRVFDDAGDGYFSWVENALQWVHDNRDSFENPITAVNLSLGVATWNSDAIPSWANLENEFNLLKQDGIFVSVSAGNSFTSFNEAGLSYPAASEHVVPVASVDDSGLLSYYSQRNSRVIAAPGRGIISTVPDYAGDSNGTTDDYASFSGTSMAAPYVAGASVIIREAMEFVGYTNITQQTIYNHMISTADSFYDSATNAYYNRLNLDSAIDALMPDDDFGSSIATAHNLGTLDDSTAMSGAITTLDDIDYFKFTTASSATVTFTAANLTHDVVADWEISGGTGAWSGANNETFTIEVVAGQEYTVGFSSVDGLGYYDLDIDVESSLNYTDWGTIRFSEMDGLSNSGETWYRVESTSAGYLTAEAFFDAGSGQVSLEIYDSSMQSIASGNPSDGISRVDAFATTSSEFFLKVTGDNSDIDFRLTNLVDTSGTTVTVLGTDSDDTFTFNAGSTHQLTVNSVSYAFDAVSVSNFQFDGGAGSDTITLTGTSGNEDATLRLGEAVLAGSGFTVASTSTETNILQSGGGTDVATFYDSAGDDIYIARSDRATLVGDGFSNEAIGFGETHAYATTGQDQATFYDSAGDDVYVGRATRAELRGADFDNSVYDFDNTRAYSSTGHDHAVFYDSAGDDVYVAWADRALITGANYYNDAYGFERTLAYSSTGNDKAVFHDSSGDDIYVARSDRTSLSGEGYYNTVYNFSITETYATTGNDRAVFHDTAGDDVLVSRVQQSSLRGSGYFNRAWNFGIIDAYATSGYDIGILYDSDGDDVYVGRSTSAYLRGDGFKNSAYAFDRTITYASGGNDTAVLYDSAGDDIYVARAERAHLVGDGFYNDIRNFNYTLAYASTGNDRVVFHDTTGNDIYVAWADRALMTGAGYYNDTRGFNRTEAYANGGNDRAVLHDSENDDSVHAESWGAYVGDGEYHNEAHAFEVVDAYSTHGGTDVATEVEALDYLFSNVGSWT